MEVKSLRPEGTGWKDIIGVYVCEVVVFMYI